jgi:hypothetical protein
MAMTRKDFRRWTEDTTLKGTRERWGGGGGRRRNSDKNRHSYKKILKIIQSRIFLKLTHPVSSFTDSSFVHSSSLAVSVQTLIINLHITLSLPFFLLLVGGWLLSYPYRCFLWLWKSQNVYTHCQKCHIFMTRGGKTWTPVTQKRILRDRVTGT